MHGDGDAFVNFRLGREGFGIPLAQVREIARVGKIAEVPMAPAAIRGLANLRGRVVTLIDVSRLFSLPLPEALGPHDRLALVLASPFEHLALFVHAPVEIAHASQARAALRTAAMTASGDGSSAGLVAPRPGAALLNMVSAADLVARCEARVIEGFRKKI